MRIAAVVIAILLASPARSAVIEVSPGPGTPIQDAIDAASAGDRIIVHAGDYPESIVVDKKLRIVGDGQVGIGPDIGQQQSSCSPAFALDITADRVSIDGGRGVNNGIRIAGGGVAAVHVAGRDGVRLRKVGGTSFCTTASGLDLEDVARMKIQSGYFLSVSSSGQGTPACRLSQVARGRVDLAYIECTGGIIGAGPYFGGPGLLLDGVTAPRVGAAVVVTGSVFQSRGDVPVALRGAGAVRIARSFLLGSPRILGGPDNSCIDIDAASSGNSVSRSMLEGPIADQGTGNCFRRNVDQNKVPLADVCS
jgi:hypothetical protein